MIHCLYYIFALTSEISFFHIFLIYSLLKRRTFNISYIYIYEGTRDVPHFPPLTTSAWLWSYSSISIFNFCILIIICLGVDLLGFILFEMLCFLNLHVCFLIQVWEVFRYNFFQICFLLLSLLYF